jgi:5-methylcytosine-specific restriction endonuclease McrA
VYMGAPCKHGHSGERRTVNRSCVECSKKSKQAYDKALRVKNPEGASVRLKYWRKANRAKQSEYFKDYYAKNKTKRNKQSCANRRKRKLKKVSTAYVHAQHLKRVERYKAEGSHTYKEVLALVGAQNFQCKVCDASVRRMKHADHIVPLSRGGSDFIHNIQILCKACNLSKGNKTMEEWAQHKARLSRFKDAA